MRLTSKGIATFSGREFGQQMMELIDEADGRLRRSRGSVSSN